MTTSTQLERVVIIGHTGFIGSHLALHIREHTRQFEILGFSLPEFDLTREKAEETLAKYFNERTTVIMCAGIKRNFGDNLATFSTNIALAVNLCKAIERQPVRKLIFFSSAAVYGEDQDRGTITEETTIQPTTYYGLAKHVSEALLVKVFGVLDGAVLTLLRPPTIYGPDESVVTYSPSGFVKTVLRGGPVVLWGDGQELREFIYVKDVAAIVQYLTLHDAPGVFNLSCAESHSFAQILDMIALESGMDVMLETRVRTKAKVDHRFCNTKLLRAIPGFRFAPIGSAIREVIARELKSRTAETTN